MEHGNDEDWCSVNEAARRLKVTPTAIRNRIKRRTLETKPNGNHGRLVRVPLTVTGTGSDTVPPTVTDTVPLTVPPTDYPSVVDVLNRLTERLETELGAVRMELASVKVERDAERERAADLATEATTAPVLRGSVEALRQALDSERQHKAELRRELDLARRPWWRRLAG